MLQKLKEVFKSLHVDGIARRYFILNGFDGILTILGISVGAYIAKVSQPSLIISSSIGTAVGLMVSGVTGAYVTEKAERLGQLKKLKQTMVSDMEGSVQEKNVKTKSTLIAIINGISPMLCALISMVPYFLAHLGLIEMVNTAYYASMTVSGILLILFGSFLGKISKESVFKYAGMMVGAGIITASLSILLGVGTV